jgi:hypothetical protein
MADPREEAIRRRYYQPRSLMAEKAAGSRAGQVYHTMTSLQDRMASPDYATDEADTDQLKAIRRDWNREQKYTPMGMNVSGATSPLDAQNRFMGTTETFRQANPQAYGTMYPLSQAAMKLGEYGGLMGLAVRGLTGKLGNTVRERFPIINKTPEINELVPPTGLANLVPEHIRQKALFDINETIEGREGIFGGTSALEEPDLEKYIPPISNRVLAEWIITIKPADEDLTVERAEELIRDLEPTAKQIIVERYKESQ